MRSNSLEEETERESHSSNSSGSGSRLLQDLQRDYILAKPPQQIKHLDKCLSDKSIGSERLFKLSQEEWAQPPVQCRIAFIKYVIKKLEGSETMTACGPMSATAEHDDLSVWYDALESLVSQTNCQWEPFYRFYDIFGRTDEDEASTTTKKTDLIKILEHESAFVAEGTTGLVTWEASVQLAKWLSASKDDVISANQITWVLELGCGCGFLAVAGMKMCPQLRCYVATDGHPNALAKCEENVRLNFGEDPKITFRTELIDWVTDADQFQKLVQELTDKYGNGLLIGADIVFDPQIASHLTNLLNIFLTGDVSSSNTRTAILSCTIRNEATVEALFAELHKYKNIQANEIYKWENGVIFKMSQTSVDQYKQPVTC